MSDASSPEQAPYDHDLSELSDDAVMRTHSYEEPAMPLESAPAPRIKLKLRLNPSQPFEDDTKKKRNKHKKKHHHKKHKKRHNEDSDMVDVDGHWPRRESEQVNIDDEDAEDVNDRQQPNHVPVGGKRPFAALQASEHQVEHDNPDSSMHSHYEHDLSDLEDEDEDYQTESYHPMEHPSSSISPVTPKHSKTSKIEKPKKRGRPSKARLAAEAAAAAAAADRATSEFIKKDFGAVCDKLLESLIKRDAYGFFLEPVDTQLVPDYATVIKHPMDFSTMRKKLKTNQYHHMDQVLHDFKLIVNNAKTYNAPNTIYWKNADKLQNYGVRAIERAGRTVSYEPVAETVTHEKSRQNSWPRKLSIVPIKKEPSIKAEEEVDILGLDNSMTPLRKASRQDSEGAGMTRETSVDFASGSRALTPVRGQSKKKKKKAAEAGVVYAPDGSVNMVGGVADLSTLLPPEPAFSDPPQFVTLNPQALPSAFYLNRAEDWFTRKHLVHPAYFCDYGPFTTLGIQAPGEFYTAQDASYIYPLYGTGQGEAYMRSMWDFVEGLDLQDSIADKSRQLTRGAWDVVNEVLKGKEDSAAVDTEFGLVDVPTVLEAMK